MCRKMIKLDGEVILSLLQRERPPFRPRLTAALRFQPTLPRGERPYKLWFTYDIPPISIHAPARGATGSLLQSFAGISNFNPRSREGSDGNIRDQYVCTYTISIHAPARGATFPVYIFPCIRLIFQSTLPRGERPGGTGGRRA